MEAPATPQRHQQYVSSSMAWQLGAKPATTTRQRLRHWLAHHMSVFQARGLRTASLLGGTCTHAATCTAEVLQHRQGQRGSRVCHRLHLDTCHRPGGFRAVPEPCMCPSKHCPSHPWTSCYEAPATHRPLMAEHLQPRCAFHSTLCRRIEACLTQSPSQEACTRGSAAHLLQRLPQDGHVGVHHREHRDQALQHRQRIAPRRVLATLQAHLEVALRGTGSAKGRGCNVLVSP